MSKKQSPFRYDIVGSFLRPAKLKEARKQFEEGQLDAKGLKQVEDEAITDLIEKIKAAGYHTLTDGEFRRATWHLDFMWACDGIAHKPTKTGLPFHGEQAMIDDTYLVGKIALKNEHPFVEHFRFVQSFEDENTVAKQTIPAPAQFLAQFIMPFNDAETKKYYSDRNALIDDIVAVYQKTIDQLYEAGCRNLQLDDCTWGMLVDETAPSFFNTDAEGLKAYQILFKDINNAVIDYAPKDFVINTHICRGNYHSAYAGKGAYDAVADVVFGKENANAYFLEYDDARSGSFAPLAKLTGEKKVVLGLVTTKKPQLEDKDEVIRRIREAENFVPLERLYLSPQCGFASCEIGNKLTEEEQWAKLKLVKDIAKEVWG